MMDNKLNVNMYTYYKGIINSIFLAYILHIYTITYLYTYYHARNIYGMYTYIIKNS